MTITGDYLLIALILLGLGLTIFALKATLVLFRLGAAMTWLALGMLFLTDQFGLGLGDPWTQVIATVFIVMAIAVLSLQWITDIRHEAKVRGKSGYPGASTESWSSWGPKPKQNHKQTALERQAEYKAILKDKTGRK